MIVMSYNSISCRNNDLFASCAIHKEYNFTVIYTSTYIAGRLRHLPPFLVKLIFSPSTRFYRWIWRCFTSHPDRLMFVSSFHSPFGSPITPCFSIIFRIANVFPTSSTWEGLLIAKALTNSSTPFTRKALIHSSTHLPFTCYWKSTDLLRFASVHILYLICVTMAKFFKQFPLIEKENLQCLRM